MGSSFLLLYCLNIQIYKGDASSLLEFLLLFIREIRSAHTIHANYRFFQVMDPLDKEKVAIWWFGGGSDLTPYYLFEEDACFFHSQLKDTCDKFHPHYFDVFSKWANNYFYIKHRNEHRGIGGLFFDYLDDDMSKSLFRANESSVEFSQELKDLADDLLKKGTQDYSCSFVYILEFVKSCGKSFMPLYGEIIRRRKNCQYSEKERMWQLYRRGRYVEFNLVYDRGTVFGLQTGGRVESILMSLPPLVRFEYNYSPEEGSPEATLLKVLKGPREWHLESA